MGDGAEEAHKRGQVGVGRPPRGEVCPAQRGARVQYGLVHYIGCKRVFRRESIATFFLAEHCRNILNLDKNVNKFLKIARFIFWNFILKNLSLFLNFLKFFYFTDFQILTLSMIFFTK